MLIDRYEKADRPFKVASTSATTSQPISNPPTRQLQAMCLGFLHRLEKVSLYPCNLDDRTNETVPGNRSKPVAASVYDGLAMKATS